jgi:hypothetical protein
MVFSLSPTAAAQPCGLQFDSFTPRPLNTNAGMDGGIRDLDVHLVNSGTGTWMAAWRVLGGMGNDADLYFSRSVDAGLTWSPPASLNTTAATDSHSDDSARLATNGQGVWIAVWWAQNAFGGSIGTDMDILFARSLDDGVTWSSPAILNTNAATDEGNDLLPRVATDGAGRWVAIWVSADSLGGTIGADRDILVSRSTDNGGTWSPPAMVNHYAATDNSADDYPELAMSAAGECVAVWLSDNSLGGTIGTDEDILASTSLNGGQTWSTAIPVNTNVGDRRNR